MYWTDSVHLLKKKKEKELDFPSFTMKYKRGSSCVVSDVQEKD